MWSPLGDRCPAASSSTDGMRWAHSCHHCGHWAQVHQCPGRGCSGPGVPRCGLSPTRPMVGAHSIDSLGTGLVPWGLGRRPLGEAPARQEAVGAEAEARPSHELEGMGVCAVPLSQAVVLSVPVLGQFLIQRAPPSPGDPEEGEGTAPLCGQSRLMGHGLPGPIGGCDSVHTQCPPGFLTFVTRKEWEGILGPPTPWAEFAECENLLPFRKDLGLSTTPPQSVNYLHSGLRLNRLFPAAGHQSQTVTGSPLVTGTGNCRN